jgi:FlaA1/EpsC-like NDP-sugar epimerase
MGASKRLGGQMMLARAPSGGRYSVVRFGNVFGSRGSVIPTFAQQIAAGGPVTVTDPRMTRFFMSVEEAVQLVLQAAVLAEGGDAFMLEMGEPVNILELAKRMVRLSGYSVGTDIAIRLTGRRPGEKLVEELRTADEEVLDAPHPSILRLRPANLTVGVLDESLVRMQRLAEAAQDEALARMMLDVSSAAPTSNGQPHHVIDLVGQTGARVWNRSSI